MQIILQCAFASWVFALNGVTWPLFTGFGTMGEDCSAPRVIGAVRAYESMADEVYGEHVSAVLEAMVHVGFPGSGWDDFNESQARKLELDVWESLRDELPERTSYAAVATTTAVTPETVPSHACITPREDGPKKVAIISKLGDGTGNCVTANRIAASLRQYFRGCETFLLVGFQFAPCLTEAGRD